ncbi:matrixin family metalloprotease [Brevibacillus reuszeri]
MDSEAYNLPIEREQELCFQAVMAHEIGHAIGIAHIDFDSATLMYKNIEKWTKWGIYFPDADAPNAAIAMY